MKKRRVFFSFHYAQDNWRVAQIRNAGVIEGNKPVSDNEWESLADTPAIKKWVDSQLSGASCTIVLIGSHTAESEWIHYEIKKSWDEGKGLLGIYIHKLKNQYGKQSPKGENPFDNININGQMLSTIVKSYNPPYGDSKDAYHYVKIKIAEWIEDAIRIRQNVQGTKNG